MMRRRSGIGSGLGRYQRDALAKLAGAPDGLTPSDLACLARSGDRKNGRAQAARVLHSLMAHGYVRLTGELVHGPGRPSKVWAITGAGRSMIAEVLADRSRPELSPAERRAAVVTALAQGHGPGLPPGDVKAAALKWFAEGWRKRDIALVLGIADRAVTDLLRGAGQ